MVSGVLTNKAEIIEAIHKKRGIISHAAQYMKIHHQTIYDWMERDQDVAKAVIDAREQNRKDRLDADESILNMAYDSIQDLIRGRDVTATIFAMKCKAKWSDKAGEEANQGVRVETVQYDKAADG